MSNSPEVQSAARSLSVQVERTIPEVEPPPTMEFDELQPWLAQHPDLREIALKLVADVTVEVEVEPETSAEANADDAIALDDDGIDLEDDELISEDVDAALEANDATVSDDEPSLALVKPGLEDGEAPADAECSDTPSEDGDTEPAAEPAATLKPVPHEDRGRRTLTLHRTLRSGAVVRFEGDVVLFGDLNPGAQIVASGNIIVLGGLKGLAHAGCTGDEDSFILGFDLKPTQLRIARHIAIPPKRQSARQGIEPELARISGDGITIQPYRARSTRALGA